MSISHFLPTAQLPDTTLSSAHALFQTALNYVRYLLGVLRGRENLGDNSQCANHQRHNLNCRLIHLSDLPCQILLPLYFRLLHHDVLIPRNCNVNQDPCIAAFALNVCSQYDVSKDDRLARKLPQLILGYCAFATSLRTKHRTSCVDPSAILELLCHGIASNLIALAECSP